MSRALECVAFYCNNTNLGELLPKKPTLQSENVSEKLGGAIQSGFFGLGICFLSYPPVQVPTVNVLGMAQKYKQLVDCTVGIINLRSFLPGMLALLQPRN